MIIKNAFIVLISAIVLAACSKSNHDDTTINNTDELFMQQVSYLNYAFKDAAALTANHSDYDSIQSFSNDLLATANKIQSDMNVVAANLFIQLPMATDSAHKAQAAYLSTLYGHKFDTNYIDAQVANLEDAINLYDEELSDGNNVQIVDIAKTYLSAIVNFSQDAADIQAQIE